jgi:exopolysaccharide biosynthesis WecB/TagA/CpsF family protein
MEQKGMKWESFVEPYKSRIGVVCCSTHTISQLVDEVRLLLSDKSLQPRTILCVNAHIYNLASTDPGLRQIINDARIVTADGMSILWASHLFGVKILERTNMTETFRAFLQAEDIPDNIGILIGLTEEEGTVAAQNIEKVSTHCRIIKTFSGFLSEEAYMKIFSELANIDFIFLGMGTPKTEKIAQIASVLYPEAIVWGIGGGTIRILAGTMKEAPVFLRRVGLQWLHRLCCDPRKLWGRYLVGNPVFIYKICKARLRSQ